MLGTAVGICQLRSPHFFLSPYSILFESVFGAGTSAKPIRKYNPSNREYGSTIAILKSQSREQAILFTFGGSGDKQTARFEPLDIL